jgi:hypothetical protein
VFAAGLLTACTEKPPEPVNRAKQLVDEAKDDIGNKFYPKAMQKCETAEEIDASYDEAKYCVLAANLGQLVQATSKIVSLVAANLSPGDYQTQLEVKKLIGSLLGEIEGYMASIDLYAYKLAEMDDPKFRIESFPLDLDIGDLLGLIGNTDIQISSQLELNMRGTWDKSQVVLLGAAFNAAQAALDYLLSHKLVVDDTNISFETTGDVAAFLVNNPELLTADGDAVSLGRLNGDAIRKGLKNDVLAAVSFLVGRDAPFERVSPAHDGLKEAIKQSAAAADPDAVIRWVDANGDGIPEEFGVPAIAQLSDQIQDKDGKPLIKDDTFANPLKEDTWAEILAFGTAVRDNIEGNGGTPVSLTNFLRLIVRDLEADASRTRLVLKEVPDVIAVNPAAFLKAPKSIQEMAPYYYQYEYRHTVAGATKTAYDFVIETELYGGASTNYVQKAGSPYVYSGAAADFTHFYFPASGVDEYAEGFTVTAYAFDNFASRPSELPVDKVVATAKTPRLWYFALPDPTFGGMLLGDPAFKGDGTGGKYVAMDNFSLNKIVNKLLKYYCIDTTEFSFDMLDEDSATYAANPIGQCTEANQPLEN